MFEGYWSLCYRDRVAKFDRSAVNIMLQARRVTAALRLYVSWLSAVFVFVNLGVCGNDLIQTATCNASAPIYPGGLAFVPRPVLEGAGPGARPTAQGLTRSLDPSGTLVGNASPCLADTLLRVGELACELGRAHVCYACTQPGLAAGRPVEQELSFTGRRPRSEGFNLRCRQRRRAERLVAPRDPFAAAAART